MDTNGKPFNFWIKRGMMAMIQNYYYTTESGTNVISFNTGNSVDLQVNGSANYLSNPVSFSVKSTSGIHPELYFKYIKSKFKVLERLALDRQLKKIEKAFYKAVEAGQEALGKKILNEIVRETKEATIAVKGIKYFIERDDLMKHKRNIRGGHISDTKIADFTRIIPDCVLEKKAKVNDVFDDFVIFHYYNEEQKDLKKLSPEEKFKMRDPVLFGIIKETNRLYFVADWEDEFCDLTFNEILDVMGKDRKDVRMSSEPNLTT
jgi:uncharacterized protein with ATP-grasp and redox domains